MRTSSAAAFSRASRYSRGVSFLRLGAAEPERAEPKERTAGFEALRPDGTLHGWA